MSSLPHSRCPSLIDFYVRIPYSSCIVLGLGFWGALGGFWGWMATLVAYGHESPQPMYQEADRIIIILWEIFVLAVCLMSALGPLSFLGVKKYEQSYRLGDVKSQETVPTRLRPWLRCLLPSRHSGRG